MSPRGADAPQPAPKAQRPPGAVFPAGRRSSFPLVLPLCLSASLWRQHGARRCTRAVGVGNKGIRKIPPLGPWGRCSVSSPAVCSGKRRRAAGTSSLLAHPRPSPVVPRSREIPFSPSSFSSSLPGSQRMTFYSPPFRGFSALRSQIGPRGEKAEHHLLVTATASLLLGEGESGGAAPWGTDPRQSRPCCDIGDGDHRCLRTCRQTAPGRTECSWEPSKETPQSQLTGTETSTKKFPGNNTAGRGQTQRHEAAAATRYLSPCFAATPLDHAGTGQPRGSLSPVPACTRCKYQRADKSQGKTGQRHQER